MTAPVHRQTPQREIVDLHNRVRILEAVSPAAAATAPGITAWAEANASGITLPKTTGGAGFGGSEWAVVPMYWNTGVGFNGVMWSNAVNNTDTDHGFQPTAGNGDLYQLGYRIYSLHYPLTDYGFVSGDHVSSIRIADTYTGTYKVTIKVIAYGDSAGAQAVALAAQCFDFEGPFNNWAAAGGNQTFDNPEAGSLSDPYSGGFSWAAFTEPGSTEYTVTGTTVAIWEAVVATATTGPYDIVLRGWNPGPDDVTIDVGCLVEKLDTSIGIFSE